MNQETAVDAENDITTNEIRLMQARIGLGKLEQRLLEAIERGDDPYSLRASRDEELAELRSARMALHLGYSSYLRASSESFTGSTGGSPRTASGYAPTRMGATLPPEYVWGSHTPTAGISQDVDLGEGMLRMLRGDLQEALLTVEVMLGLREEDGPDAVDLDAHEVWLGQQPRDTVGNALAEAEAQRIAEAKLDLSRYPAATHDPGDGETLAWVLVGRAGGVDVIRSLDELPGQPGSYDWRAVLDSSQGFDATAVRQATVDEIRAALEDAGSRPGEGYAAMFMVLASDPPAGTSEDSSPVPPTPPVEGGQG